MCRLTFLPCCSLSHAQCSFSRWIMVLSTTPSKENAAGIFWASYFLRMSCLSGERSLRLQHLLQVSLTRLTIPMRLDFLTKLFILMYPMNKLLLFFLVIFIIAPEGLDLFCKDALTFNYHISILSHFLISPLCLAYEACLRSSLFLLPLFWRLFVFSDSFSALSLLPFSIYSTPTTFFLFICLAFPSFFISLLLQAMAQFSGPFVCSEFRRSQEECFYLAHWTHEMETMFLSLLAEENHVCRWLPGVTEISCRLLWQLCERTIGTVGSTWDIPLSSY